MQKILLISMVLLLIQVSRSEAQSTYTQGDITATVTVSGSHDSTTCESTAFCTYDLVVNNSFIGDVVTLKDQQSGNVYFTSTNTLGQNPWTLNFIGFPSTVTDDNVILNVADFFFPTTKIISGTDTIYNMNVNYQIPVLNPCNYAPLSGRVYLDYNNDCIYNTNDVPLSNMIVNTLGTLSSSVGYYIRPGFTDNLGMYNVNMQNSWLTNCQVYLSPDYQFIFPASTCAQLMYNFSSFPQANVDFALQCSSAIDVNATASHPATARPNIPFILHPSVSNTGCDTAYGVMTLIKDPNTIYDPSQSTNPATYVNGDTLQWNYSQLSNLSNGSYWNSFLAGVYLTPNNTVNIGDTLCFSLSTTVMSNDIDATNNQYSFCMPVVNSYDPNAKEVLPKGIGAAGNIQANTAKLDYTIQFQNTGTAPAYTVSIIDTLDSDLDWTTFKIVSASHTMSPEWLAPGIVKFTFNNIMLADSFSNEAASHGQIQYSIQLKNNLALGTQIKNTGYIYFDNNPAIVTNTTLNTIWSPSGIAEVSKDGSILVYPNPSWDEVHVKLLQHSKQQEVDVVINSLNGVLVKQVKAFNEDIKIDVSDMAAGLYFIQVRDGDRMTTHKFIKE